MAVYNFVSSDEIIANVWLTFNLNYSDWKGKARQWIGNALELMNIFNSFEDISTDVYFSNYTAPVPVKMRVLRAVEYNGFRIGKSLAINHRNRDRGRLPEYNSDNTVEYSLNAGKNAIILNVEEGCVTFHYKSMPVDCNGFPIVADDGNLKEALIWYVIYQILLNGYKHPTGITFDYAYQMFERYHGRAKTSVGRLDADGRENHMQLWTSLIRNYNAWGNTFFEPTSCDRCVNTIDATEKHKVTFGLNVAGAVISLEPTVGINVISDIVSFYRPNGTYAYHITADGYHSTTGNIKVHDGDIIKSIDLIHE